MKLRELLIYLHSLFLNPDLIERIFEMERPLDIMEMSDEDLVNLDRRKARSMEKFLRARKEGPDQLFDKLSRFKGRVYTCLDDDFPLELRNIDQGPKVLYCLGRDLDLSGTRLAFVGARKSTKYGAYATKKLIGDLAAYRPTIISGMAQGIDALAHRAALDQGLYSIGVLGSGVDVVFPKSNLSLFDRMKEEGSLVSEYPLGTGPQPYYFPERNRIISGLSQAVIVIEAKEKSGSLITARKAYEQGREVFSLPGNINSIYSGGTNRLIQDGALALLSAGDIVNQLGMEEEEVQLVEDLALSPMEELILKNIDQGNNTLDRLVEVSGFSIDELTAHISLLEIKGLIENFGSQGFQRT